jgi:hypothetical protein
MTKNTVSGFASKPGQNFKKRSKIWAEFSALAMTACNTYMYCNGESKEPN